MLGSVNSASRDDSHPGSSDCLLSRVIDEYFDQLSQGEDPDLADYVRRYPQIAETILHGLPALQLIGAESGGWSDCDDRGKRVRQLGDYRILHEVGRGGMGIVYKAEQKSLGRIVALKILPFAAVLDQRQINRFKNEANAAAMLHHTNVVPVFGIGCERGIYYYAMQYIEGQTITEVIRDLRRIMRRDEDSLGDNGTSSGTIVDSHVQGGKPDDSQSIKLVTKGCLGCPSINSDSIDDRQGPSWTSGEGSARSADFYRNIAALGIDVAKALECAHDEGIIHRDIKPSNLIVDAQGKIWVTDFGLARVEAAEGMTFTGDVLGTLRYMSPEQVLARPGIDHRADIYSLGVTLFELLTLEPAVGSSNREEMIQQILNGQPRSLRRINRKIPRELETIVLKAMEREPQQRYETAGDLAEDLRRFVENLPIKAKRPSLVEKIIKWSRRHSDLSWASAIFLLCALIGMTAGALWSSHLLRRANDHKKTANLARVDAERAKEELRQELYARDIKSAFLAYHKNWSGEVARLLQRQVPDEGEEDYRGFEWHLLKQLNRSRPPTELIGHVGAVNSIVVYREGARLASAGEDGTIRVWDLHDQRALFTLVDDRSEEGKSRNYTAIAVSADGKLLAAGGNVLSLWDLERREWVRDLATFPTHISSVVFSPDGRMVAAHSANEMAKVISLDDLVVKQINTGHGSHRIAFMPDGGQLAIPYKKPREMPGVKPQGIQVWNTSTWELVREIEVPSVRGLSFLDDGRFLLTGKYGSTVRLVRMSDGEVVYETAPQRSQIADLVCAPDDRAIAAIFRDGSLVYWRLRPDWQSNVADPFIGDAKVISAHTPEGRVVEFVDTNRVATCGDDGHIRIWQINERPGTVQHERLDGHAISCPNEDEIWVMTDYGVEVIDTQSLTTLDRIELWQTESKSEPSETSFVTFSEDARLAVVSNRAGEMVFWDRQGRREVRRIRQIDIRKGQIVDTAISPDSAWLANISYDESLRIRTMEGKEVLRIDLGGLEGSVEFSPDGQHFAYSDSDGGIHLLTSGDWRGVAMNLSKAPVIKDGLQFTPDGRFIVTAHSDSVLRVWDGKSLDSLGEFKGHTSRVYNFEIHPNGCTVASAAEDRTVRLWYLPTFSELGQLRLDTHDNRRPRSCRFSEDGTKLYVINFVENDMKEISVWKTDEHADLGRR